MYDFCRTFGTLGNFVRVKFFSVNIFLGEIFVSEIFWEIFYDANLHFGRTFFLKQIF